VDLQNQLRGVANELEEIGGSKDDVELIAKLRSEATRLDVEEREARRKELVLAAKKLLKIGK